MKILTTVVGSYPANIGLSAHLKGLYYHEDIYKKAIEDCVKDQLSAGIDIISDGQCRDDMIKQFTKKLKGIRVSERSEIINKIEFIEPITFEDIKYAKKIIQKNRKVGIKGIVTGPYTLASSCIDKYYNNREKASYDFAIALAMEIKKIEKEVDMVQIDEPYFSVEYPSYGRDLIESMINKVKKPIALHVCGDIADIFKNLIEYKVDVLDHEFAKKPELINVIKGYSFKQKIGFGCVRSDDENVEDVETIKKRIEKIISILGEEKIYIDPDCGLRNLPREIAYKKLCNMVKARNLICKLSE